MTEPVPDQGEIPMPPTGGELTPSGNVSMQKTEGGHPALALTDDLLTSVVAPVRFHVSARLDDNGGVSCQIGGVASWNAPGADGESVVNYDVPADELGDLERAFVALVAKYRVRAMQDALANGYEAHKVNYNGIPAPTPSAPEEGV